MKERKFDIYFNEPFQNGREIEYIKEALDSNWLSTEGDQIQCFQNDLGKYLGTDNILLTNSGTSAIHLALMALGIGKGDMVICQSFTFVASANPILYQQATPVFVDSEPETWNMSPDFLSEAIDSCLANGKKPKAVIVAHTYGTIGRIEEIQRICAEHEIPLIEDAAEAIGSSYKGQPAGTFGDISILSFNGNKIITSTSGGALISKRKHHILHASSLANQSKDAEYPYNHIEIGFNYKMSNICAAIVRAQMENLEVRVKMKREIFNLYYSILFNASDATFQAESNDSFSNKWATTLTIGSQGVNKIIVDKLLEGKIESRILWKPIHLLPHFKGNAFFGHGVCQNIHQSGIALPSGIGINLNEIKRIAKLVKDTI